MLQGSIRMDRLMDGWMDGWNTNSRHTAPKNMEDVK
jgi:hypothetical protein